MTRYRSYNERQWARRQALRELFLVLVIALIACGIAYVVTRMVGS